MAYNPDSEAGENSVSLVTLVSGGLDSTLMCLLAAEEGIEFLPLFIDYGQLATERELTACRDNFKRLGFPAPEIINLSGFGRTITSGLTCDSKDIFLDAFLPGRNMLFLLMGAAYAYQKNADAVAIGLLREDAALFADQTRRFLNMAEDLLGLIIEVPVQVLAPLMGMTKAEVVALAKAKGVSGTWSCHKEGPRPCGSCIACREYEGLEV